MIKGTQTAFLFVPHRAGTNRNDRTFINTHLSHRAAERRKRAKSRTQSLAGVPPKSPIVHIEVPHSQPQQHGNASPRDADVTTTTEASLPLHESDYGEGDSEVDRTTLSSEPTTFLDNDAGDPFSSTLIPMTAPVRALLHFNDKMFQPWGEGLEKGSNKRAAFSNKFFQTSNQSLHDMTTGYAFLARLASMAATLTSSEQLAMVATGFKSQAYENLRQHLVANGMETSQLMYTQMFSLLAMEVAAHNLDAAAVHAQTLQQLIQNAPVTESIKIGEDLICSVLWHECIRGGFSLGRPVFEIDKLLNHGPLLHTLASVRRKLLNRGLMPLDRTNGFKKAELSNDICACVGELRFLSDLGYAFKGAPELVTEDVMKAFSYRATFVSSRLLNLYNDAQDYLEAKTYPDHIGELHTAGVTCLAARFWYRVATSHELVDVAPTAGFQVYRVYGTHKPILKRLREAYEVGREEGEVNRRQNLWLWILYVGTLAERANVTLDQETKHHCWDYFNTHLVHQARLMGLFSWTDVEDVLNTFLYSDAVGVRSTQYFEEGMKVQLNG